MKKGRPRFLSHRLSLFRIAATALVLATLAVATSVAWVAHDVRRDLERSLPEVAGLDQLEPQKITRIHSADGELVATLFTQNYKPVELEEVGENVIDAVLAIEDARFFEHAGVDLRGVVRAAVENLAAGEIQQGASTITMQLARHLYLSDEKSYERKIREALLAQKIEELYEKEEILERYLNEVYFGSGAYGIGAASARYFGKTPAELTVAQAALLAGLIQSPTHLNPLTNHRGARHRQVEVVTAMRERGRITPEEYYQAIREATQTDFSEPPQAGQPMLKYPYFTSYAAKKLVDMYGEETVYSGGLSVRTTLDREIQANAKRLLTEVLETEGGHFGVEDGAVVVIENKTGHIKAMVGGTDWNSGDRFNRAWQAQRQPGSTFKPLLYAAALEAGMTQDSLVSDDKATVLLDAGNGRTRAWTPVNSDGKGGGQIPLRDALRRSRNQATVNLLKTVGVGSLVDMARRLGVESELPRVPSLALGTGLVTPLEMAETYSTFANEGVRRRTTPLLKVHAPDGSLLGSHGQTWSHQATSPEVARQMVDMLARAVRDGTGGQARVPGLQVAGKTGTTDDYKDAWFVGVTPRYTVAVWMGNDDNSATWHLYGGQLPAVTWRKVVASLDHGSGRTFPFFSERPTRVSYCKTTHKGASANCQAVTVDYYVAPPATAACTSCRKVQPKQPLPLGRAGSSVSLSDRDYPLAGEYGGAVEL